jgi:hypothetical protein
LSSRDESVDSARIQTSDELHERVQRFANGSAGESFDALALDIARFQADAAPGFRRLLAARGGELQRVDDIPAVPSDAFRLTRVATYPAELDAVRFHTSGTTGAERGTHVMRRTDTYEQLSLAFGRQALLPTEGGAPVVVALAPAPTTPPSSSLGYMMARFMESFDDKPLGPRWLLDEHGIDLHGLRQAITAANQRAQPLLLLGTAFALVRLLDELDGACLPLPGSSVVMQTGGFKGKSREVSMEQLRSQLSNAFQLPATRIVGEYGMTELTSQLYEATVAGSKLYALHPNADPGVYFEPPWLRVTPVDPVSLAPVAEGAVGLARFIDLGNVDSAVSVVTQDLVRRQDGGIQLLGRQPGAPARGCSLAIEALLRD